MTRITEDAFAIANAYEDWFGAAITHVVVLTGEWLHGGAYEDMYLGLGSLDAQGIRGETVTLVDMATEAIEAQLWL